MTVVFPANSYHIKRDQVCGLLHRLPRTSFEKAEVILHEKVRTELPKRKMGFDSRLAATVTSLPMYDDTRLDEGSV